MTSGGLSQFAEVAFAAAQRGFPTLAWVTWRSKHGERTFPAVTHRSPRKPRKQVLTPRPHSHEVGTRPHSCEWCRAAKALAREELA